MGKVEFMRLSRKRAHDVSRFKSPFIIKEDSSANGR